MKIVMAMVVLLFVAGCADDDECPACSADCCNDGNPCTVDRCEWGHCSHEAVDACEMCDGYDSPVDIGCP